MRYGATSMLKMKSSLELQTPDTNFTSATYLVKTIVKNQVIQNMEYSQVNHVSHKATTLHVNVSVNM